MKGPHVRRETQWGEKTLLGLGQVKKPVAAKEDWKLRCLEKAGSLGRQARITAVKSNEKTSYLSMSRANKRRQATVQKIGRDQPGEKRQRTITGGDMDILLFIFWILIGLMIGPIFHAGHGDE
jgi:hypothetical protein